jgi:surfactin synthase thioesterase subunit
MLKRDTRLADRPTEAASEMTLEASESEPAKFVDYGKWILQGPKEKRKVDEDEASLRLFCIPQAGMGAWAFHGWQETLGSAVEVMPIELPGRNSRMRENRFTSMKDLVNAMVDNLVNEFRRLPYAILGHSLGAWIAYELVQELRRRHEPLPVKIYVSANRAPHLCEKKHDVHPVHLHKLSYPLFWKAFFDRYGANKDLESEGIKKYMYPMLVDDFTLLETYVWNDLRCPELPVPIEAFGAKSDVRYTKEQISAWSEHTSVQFKELWFDGKHRFIVDEPEEVRKHVAYDVFGCMT